MCLLLHAWLHRHLSLQWSELKHLTGQCSAARSQPQLTVHSCSFAGLKMCHCTSAGNSSCLHWPLLAEYTRTGQHLNSHTHSAHKKQEGMASPEGKGPLSFSQASILLYLSLLSFSHISILSVSVSKSPSWFGGCLWKPQVRLRVNRWLTQLCDPSLVLKTVFEQRFLQRSTPKPRGSLLFLASLCGNESPHIFKTDLITP